MTKKRKNKLEMYEPLPVEAQANTRSLRCIWDSRLIIPSVRTVTGERYEFMPGQIKPVIDEDYEVLLAMETRPFGCCGGTKKPQKYFEEVE